MARCPKCNACLGEVVGDVVIQRARTAQHRQRVSISPAEATVIHCDRPRCSGIWKGERGR